MVPGMDQISPPMRIALAAAILVALAWFTVLKPKDAPEPAAATPIATPANAAAANGTAAPGSAAATPGAAASATPTGRANDPDGPAAETGLGRAVQQARGAAKQQEAADARAGAAAPTAAPTPQAGGSSAPAKPASPAATLAKATGLPRDIAGALARKEVVVLLFWDRRGSDDRAVRRAVRGLGRRGEVVVHVAPVTKVARYAAITQGVDVARSPSVVVVDRKLSAQLLAGYVSRDTIRQAIADARRPAA